MDLLTYTPPQDRDLRVEIVQERHVWLNDDFDRTFPCEIEWEDLDYVDLSGVPEFLQRRLRGLGRAPTITICTASARHYNEETEAEYKSVLIFWNRASFEAAYRVARAMQRRFPIIDFLPSPVHIDALSEHHFVPKLIPGFWERRAA